MTKLKIQQLNLTSQLTSTEQQKVSGGHTIEERTEFLNGAIDGTFSIEFGNNPIDARVRDNATGAVVAEGVRFYDDLG